MGTIAEVKESVVLFDGVCNLCNGTVNFIIDRDPTGKLRFASLQSDFGQKVSSDYGLRPNQMDSVILLKDDKVFEKSEAILRIAGMLNGLWPAFGIFRILPRGLRDAVYNLIARNRYSWFGRSDACRIPTKDLQYRFLDS